MNKVIDRSVHINYELISSIFNIINNFVMLETNFFIIWVGIYHVMLLPWNNDYCLNWEVLSIKFWG